MPKKFEIGEKRYLIVKKDEICMLQDGFNKIATFTYPRWSWFVGHLDEIDNSVSKLVKGEEEVKLKLHIGGGWYVSVATGYRCVDIRKYFLAQDGTVKPTCKGFAIRIPEWERVKKITRDLKDKHPKIAEAEPCWMQADHYNQEGAMMCYECNPFGDWTVV